MPLTIINMSKSYSTNLALFGNGYAMLTLWLAVAIAAVSAMMMPAKRMFVK
ncbi:MAG: hypothetical protein IJF78_05040 [Clostridia bacterium]|nr:hypothetical protein [Clostridia bacterium]